MAEGEMATDVKYFVSVVQGESERSLASLSSLNEYRASAEFLFDATDCATSSVDDSTIGTGNEAAAGTTIVSDFLSRAFQRSCIRTVVCRTPVHTYSSSWTALPGTSTQALQVPALP